MTPFGENWSLDKQHKYRAPPPNRVSRYLNVFRPDGNATELGDFYFCRHPEHCLTKSASGLFAVDIITGLAKYYSNNSQAGNRGTVRRHRENNTGLLSSAPPKKWNTIY